VLIALGLMRDDDLHLARLIPRPRSVGAVFENLREGLSYVRHTPIVLLAVTTVGLTATFGMNFQVVIPPLAQDALHSDASGYGFLMTASGLGALAAAVWLVIGGRPRPIRIALGAIILGVASIALAMSTSYPISLLLMVPIGAGGITMAATANATIQLAVPDGLRGRVMSVYTTVFSTSMPVGGLLMGILASRAGILEAIAIGGILSLLTGLAVLAWYRRIRVPSIAAGATVVPTTPATDASAAMPQSIEPSTSAAFNPPNPNEVLSTRR
jgi:predicted MFS family arabinose efflux permease